MAGKTEHLGWMKKAQSFVEWKQYKQAIKAFDQAIKAKPNYPEAWEAKGKMLMDMGDFGGAVQAFDKLIKITPTVTNGWVLRSTALEEGGDLAAAGDCWQQSMAEFPDDPTLIFLYGVYLNRQKQFEAALVQFDRATAMGSNPFLLMARSAALEHLGRPLAALGDLDRIELEYGPMFMVSKARADLFVSLERYDEPLQAYDLAVEIAPEQQFLWLAKGLLLEQLEAHEPLIDWYDTAIAVLGPIGHLFKAEYLTRINQAEAALTEFQTYLAKHPDDGSAYYGQGLCWLMQANEDLGWRSLQTAIQLDPSIYAVAMGDALFVPWRDRLEFLQLEPGEA
jgi:tetratricopeptide (TPR) repeat protein